MSAPQSSVVFADQDLLFRRISKDSQVGGAINRNAYQYNGKPPQSGEVSVDLARLTTKAGSLGTRPTFGLGAISVAAVRAVGLDVAHRPELQSFAHCVIVGATSKAICKQLAEATTLIVLCDDNRTMADLALL